LGTIWVEYYDSCSRCFTILAADRLAFAAKRLAFAPDQLLVARNLL
jgi:hypothetical protein